MTEQHHVGGNDTRYPYTYANDYIRHVAGYNENGTKLSRADADQLIETFALIMGLSEEVVYRKLADFWKEHEDEIVAKSVDEFCKLKGLKT